LRGQGCNILIAEEAAYMDEECFEKVISPLMLMQDIVCIFISTVRGGSFYDKVFDKRHPDTQELLFMPIRVSMTCDLMECRTMKRRCLHCLEKIPPWQTPFSHDVAHAMIDNTAESSRELCGIIADDGFRVFQPEAITAFMEARVTDPSTIGEIWFSVTAVDPNNDGPSATAILTLLVSPTTLLVRKEQQQQNMSLLSTVCFFSSTRPIEKSTREEISIFYIFDPREWRVLADQMLFRKAHGNVSMTMTTTMPWCVLIVVSIWPMRSMMLLPMQHPLFWVCISIVPRLRMQQYRHS
jgi:hypothetical protein